MTEWTFMKFDVEFYKKKEGEDFQSAAQLHEGILHYGVITYLKRRSAPGPRKSYSSLTTQTSPVQ